jgi:RNA polymerase sigma-70 factor (ECF subfamily)
MTSIQFSHLFDSNYIALTNFAKKLTRNGSDAEDLVQETAYKALKGIHTYKVGTNFKSWTFTILKNTFINKYHKRKKRGVVNNPIEDFTFALESKYALNNDAVSVLRLKEIEHQVNKLSEKSRIPFLMHFNGYQYNEIAEELNIPIGTVKSRINYARKKLKNNLKEIKAN